MRYMVSFQRDGQTCFGIVSLGSAKDPAVLAAKARGEVVVADAILPKSYFVRDADLTDIDGGTMGTYDMQGNLLTGNAYDMYVEAERKKAEVASLAVTQGVGVGSLFSIGVGDGTAHYVVTKVNKKTCRVEWRGFCLDRWTDHHFGWGGTFPVADVARYVEGGRKIAAIFAKGR